MNTENIITVIKELKSERDELSFRIFELDRAIMSLKAVMNGMAADDVSSS